MDYGRQSSGHGRLQHLSISAGKCALKEQTPATHKFEGGQEERDTDSQEYEPESYTFRLYS